MWISIQSKGRRLSQRLRNRIESYVSRALKRQQGQIANIVVTISSTMAGGEAGYRCTLRIWSHVLGVVVVRGEGATVRTATQRATAVARHVVRRRAHRHLSKYRRVPRDRFARWPMDWQTIAREEKEDQ